MSTYTAVITNTGATKLAAALASGTPLVLAQCAVGDGGGTTPTPVATQSALVDQKWIGNISSYTVNGSTLTIECAIPSTVGGWTVREIGIFDSAGALFAVASVPDSVMPAPGSGSTADLVIQFNVHVADPSGLAFTIDPDVAVATHSWCIATFLEIGNNLSEIEAAGPTAQAYARAALGLGSASTYAATAFEPAGTAVAAVNGLADEAEATVIDFSNATNQTFEVEADTVFTTLHVSPPAGQVLRKYIRIRNTDTVTHALTFPAGWTVLGPTAAPTYINPTDVVSLMVTAFGAGDANVDAVFAIKRGLPPSGEVWILYTQNWTPPLGLTEVTIDMGAGGGAGGGFEGGGGGAGEYVHATNVPVTPGVPMLATIGLGGIHNPSAAAYGGNGQDSTFGGKTAKGGGGGAPFNANPGSPGGSGGGGAWGTGPGGPSIASDGVGYPGGTAQGAGGGQGNGGGGGGATGPGSNYGPGGPGVQIDGQDKCSGGGGGGGTGGAAGGLSAGRGSSNVAGDAPTAAQPNSGSGGGGGSPGGIGADGGSGWLKISWGT